MLSVPPSAFVGCREQDRNPCGGRRIHRAELIVRGRPQTLARFARKKILGMQVLEHEARISLSRVSSLAQ